MMKNFILNWRASVSRDVLNENKIIHEASEEEVEVIDDILNNLDPESLMLNRAFNGQLRQVIPIDAVGGTIGDFKARLESFGYGVDLKKGVVFYETQKEHQGKVYKGKKEIKINKFLNGLQTHLAKLTKVRGKAYELRQAEQRHNNPMRPEHDPDKPFEQKEEQEATREELLKLMDYGKRGYKGMDSNTHPKSVEKWIKAWEKEAAFFKNDPEAFSKFSIIVSRHPIDVLRMSDFDEITSCHSLSSRTGEHGEYVKCAYAEALDGGAIAYVVPTEAIKDWEEEHDGMPIEDAQGEVLSDDRRDTGSIDPVSRLRIRTLTWRAPREPGGDDELYSLGVPDQRVYGSKISNFYDTLRSWLNSGQQEAIDNIPRWTAENGGNGVNMRKVNGTKITRHGGSYEDTGINTLLFNFLNNGEEDVDNKVEGNIRNKTSEYDLELPDDPRRDLWEDEVNGLVEEYNRVMEYCVVWAEVEDYGEGLTINAGGDLWLKLGAKEYLSEKGREFFGHRDYVMQVKVADSVASDYEDYGMDWADSRHGVNRLNLEVHPQEDIIFRIALDTGSGAFTGVWDTETLEQYFEEVKDQVNDIAEDTLIPLLKRTLRSEEIIKGGEFHSFVEEAVELETLEDTGWTYDYDNLQESMEIDMDDIHLDIDSIQGLEESYYDPEVIKELIESRDYRILLRQLMFRQVPGYEPGEWMLPDITRCLYNRLGHVIGWSYWITAENPPEVLNSAKKLVENVDEDRFLTAARKAYFEIAKADKKHKKQQELPLTREKKPPESEKSLNEKLHRSWVNFLRD